MNLDEITALLQEDVPTSNAPQQYGPLRQFDNELRCASRGCSSPTHFKLQGIPYCYIHCLRKMNEMLLDLGIEE